MNVFTVIVCSHTTKFAVSTVWAKFGFGDKFHEYDVTAYLALSIFSVLWTLLS